MIKYIKNATQNTITYLGQDIFTGSYYEIPAAKELALSNNSALLTDIANGIAVISKTDDSSGNITDISTAINYLKNIDSSQRDSDGAVLSRAKITTTGWHYQIQGVEFETSKLDSLHSKKADNSDYGFTVMKFHELISGVETEITGNNLNQQYLDANCIKTLMDWETNYDIEILGGMLKQATATTEDIRLWVIGVPDVPEAYGGSKSFVTNVNLKYLDGTGVKVDGKTAKYLTYSAQNHTSKIRLIFRHPVGCNHKLLMIFELFKA